MQSKNQKISALIQLNEDLENYFANTIIPQLFVDADLVLRKFTPPALKQFNLKEDYIGKPLEQLRENFRYPTIIDNIKTVIKTGKILEKEIQTTDMRWYQMNILPYKIRKENRTNGVIVTFVDITPRVTDLKEQEKLVAEHEFLLDNIAHDIKNPLFGISLLADQLITVRAKEAEFNSVAATLKSSIADMRKTVDDFAGARWQNERYQAAGELLDIQNIIEDVQLAIAPQILQTGAIITKKLQVSEIWFVRRKLRSVLYNLISNAIKYTAQGTVPQILITTTRQGDSILISVKDNGIGMNESDRQHIFEKFKRVVPIGDGSGVGLYLVHTIVSGAGGTISLESEPGKGSVFTVSLNVS